MDNINLEFFFEDESFFNKKGQAQILKNNLDQEIQNLILSSNNDLYRSNFGIILTKDQEFNLFRKYNYFKHRICEIKKWKVSNSKKQKASSEKLNDLLEVREIIIKCNTKLLINPAKKFSRSNDLDSLDCGEFISNGYLHLIKAIEKFDYRRGFKFSTYFCNVLFRNLSSDLKRKLNKVRNQYELVDSENDSVFLVNDSYVDQNNTYNKNYFEKLLNHLEADDRLRRPANVLKKNYGLCGEEKKTLSEIGKELGVSKERVRQIRNQAQEFIERNFNVLEVYDPIFD